MPYGMGYESIHNGLTSHTGRIRIERLDVLCESNMVNDAEAGCVRMKTASGLPTSFCLLMGEEGAKIPIFRKSIHASMPPEQLQISSFREMTFHLAAASRNGAFQFLV